MMDGEDIEERLKDLVSVGNEWPISLTFLSTNHQIIGHCKS